ncbi:TPA: hypothetical protein RQN03_001427 [Aeromonas dhakensis]|nr:hypothetical protein [Aeromonas dhakensis]
MKAEETPPINTDENHNENKSDYEDKNHSKNNQTQEKSFRIKRPENFKEKSYQQLKDEVRKQFIEQGDEDVPEQVVESIVDGITKNVVKRERKLRIFSFLRISLLAAIVSFIAAFSLLLSNIDGKYVGKSELQEAIKNTVAKKAHLDDLKIVFTTKSTPVRDSFWPIFKPHLYYEQQNLTLIDVLNDLKTEIYIKENTLSNEDSEFIYYINNIITDYNKVNPFDGLDAQDVRDFRGIADKLEPLKYALIQEEVSSLTSSMKVKNNLIHQYLSSSNISLYISISAFIFSVIVSIWQILASRRSSQKQLIYDAIREHQQAVST